MQKIEAPVRGGVPDGGKPVDERNWGQEELNPALKNSPDLKPLDSDISAADAMRYLLTMVSPSGQLYVQYICT